MTHGCKVQCYPKSAAHRELQAQLRDFLLQKGVLSPLKRLGRSCVHIRWQLPHLHMSNSAWFALWSLALVGDCRQAATS